MTDYDRDASIRRILLGAMLTAPVPKGSHGTVSLFRNQVQPVLSQMGIDAALIEVYTPNRSTTCKKVEGQHYILFDHGLVECIDRLDGFLRLRPPQHLVATGLQRVLAEAARSGRRADLYSFFVRRALEAEPVTPRERDEERDAEVLAAQCLLILLHEVAHAAPVGHPLHAAASHYAAVKVAGVSAQWTQILSAQLSTALSMNLPNLSEEQLWEWINFRDGMGLDDEQMGSAVGAVAGDPKFLAEIACDRVAMLLHQAILERPTNPQSDLAFLKLSERVLSAIYRTFLHLRLLKYIDDVFGHLPEHIFSGKINPLDQRSMLATGFRGTLVGQLVIDAAIEIGGQEHGQQLAQRMAEIQNDHRECLFEPLNRLLEMTILNAQFHSDLPGLLAQDGLQAVSEGASERQAIFDADSIWLQFARG